MARNILPEIAYQALLLEYEHTQLKLEKGCQHALPPLRGYLDAHDPAETIVRVHSYFQQNRRTLPVRDLKAEMASLKWVPSKEWLAHARLVSYELMLRYIPAGQGLFLPEPPPLDDIPSLTEHEARQEINEVHKRIALPFTFNEYMRQPLNSPRNQAEEFANILALNKVTVYEGKVGFLA